MDRPIRVTTRKDRSVHGIQCGVANPPKTSSDSAWEACVAKDLAFHASPRLGSLQETSRAAQSREDGRQDR